MSKILLLIIIFSFSNLLFAHKGGHHHKGADKEYISPKIEYINQQNTFATKIPLPVKEELNFQYLAILISLSLFSMAVLFALFYSIKKNKDLTHKLSFSVLFLLSICGLIACSKAEDATITTITKTDIAFLDAAFAPFKSSVTTRSDSKYYYVESNGIPSHNMMLGITSWQQQVPIPQLYTGSNAWSIPLQPEFATTPLSLKTNLMKGAIAIAANGIPIFNPLNNRGDDAFLVGELDNWGGHSGKADDYHYHTAPLFLEATVGNKPIAIAFDGFAVYGSKEPDGTAMQTLDENHGHTFNGTYHYHGTVAYPYMIAAMKGKVALDPNTSAPENQISPQAMTSAFRPAGTPLQGATITNFSPTGTNAYTLEYTLSGKKGYLKYSWDNAGNYTFVSTDVNGNSTTQTYKR